MKTQVLPITPESVALAARLLQQGELVALPTETVYGIAADARNGEAVKKIFEAKGRPQDNPLIVHICGMEMLNGIVSEVPERAKKLAAAFWPGPLTMVMPRGPGHDHRQWAGPKGFGQLVGRVGHLGHDALEHLHAVDVHDQGVILGAALGLKNLFDCFAIAGVGRDAVDRLGRQGDQLAFLQQFCRQCNAFVIHWQNLCIHYASPLFALSFSSRSAKISGSSTRSRSPSSTLCRLRSVKPMRWSVTRSCGKL